MRVVACFCGGASLDFDFAVATGGSIIPARSEDEEKSETEMRAEVDARRSEAGVWFAALPDGWRANPDRLEAQSAEKEK